MFQRVAVLGIGLIGGSFALALKERALARHIVGVARREETRREALEAGLCDESTSEPTEAARGADLVFLASPVGAMPALCAEIAPFVAPDCLITDGGSTKARVVEACEPLFDHAHFIGGHPMAGSADSGPLAARADLFEGATWILTPTPRTQPKALDTLRELVVQLGARPLFMAPQSHDELLAVSSHLPHLTASALVQTFLKSKAESPQIAELVAGGWRDSTRVAAGSAEMWRDICLDNAPSIERALDEFVRELEGLRALVSARDGAALEAWLDEAARERKNF
jgi:prephenate dehydrogenase